MMIRKFNLLISLIGLLVTSTAYPQASRAVMVQSNSGTILYPTNFWSANSAAARAGLNLAPNATNPVAPVANGGTGATNPAAARTNLGLGSTNNVTFSSVYAESGLNTGDLIYTNSGLIGFGRRIDLEDGVIDGSFNVQTISFQSPEYAATARTNLGIPWSGLTNTSAGGFRAALGLGWAALTNDYSAAGLLAYTTNGRIVSGTNLIWTNSFGFLTSLLADQVRTNLGLGWPALVNSNSANVLLGYNSTNGQIVAATNLVWTNAFNFSSNAVVEAVRNNLQAASSTGLSPDTAGAANRAITIINNDSGAIVLQYDAVGGDGWFVDHAEQFREVIGLGWPALTNNNAATTLLGYTTNGQIVAATNVVWTNAFGFSTNTVAAQVRTNLLLGATWLTNTNVTNVRSAIELGATNVVTFGGLTISLGGVIAALDGYNGLSFSGPVTEIGKGNTRTNLGLGWSALTNTNANNFVKVLTGSTNSSDPFSGTVSVNGSFLYAGSDTPTAGTPLILTFSNGILKNITVE